jgi:ParB-like chromosome segregation protein Spo0J
LKVRDPFEGIPYGVNALIRNEGSTVEQVRLSDIDLGDDLLRLRPSAREDLLVESIGMVGQQTPVVLRFRESKNRWQVVSGFRRIEALKHLKRAGVVARLFDNLSDEEAIKTAVTDNFFAGDLNGDHLDAFMERMRNENLLTGATLEFLDWAREKIARVALAATPPEELEDRVDPEEAAGGSVAELIDRTFVNLSEASQGLERIFLNWSDISASDRKLLAAECKYIHDLYPFLTR